jgi:hypothetical protein
MRNAANDPAAGKVKSAIRRAARHGSGCARLGLAQAGDTVAGLPLAAFLENLNALEAFQDIALAAQRGGRAQTAML